MSKLKNWKYPEPQGLYDPSLEKDACGVGFIVNIDGKTSHTIFEDAAKLSKRMVHRGACSADNDSGDGAGVLSAIPTQFFKNYLIQNGLEHPDQYATGIIFCSIGEEEKVKADFEVLASKKQFSVFHWREVPKNSNALGSVAKASEPKLLQPFIVSNSLESLESFDKKIYILRKMATHALTNNGSRRFYICSLSRTTIVYKGQFNPCQIWDYFLDLTDPSFESHLLIVHTRFSTNTFPSWERAHPNRLLAHNGEINTLRGNVNCMRAREGVMKSEEDSLAELYPVVEEEMSDSGCFDNVLEFLVRTGNRSLPEAVMTMVPEAWQNQPLMNKSKKNFYQWASCYMEPWDGPALLTFSDGRFVGAILDRNGLRPSRYYITTDNTMVMASEVGVFDIESEKVLSKGRLQPGKMLLVDTFKKSVIEDEELKLNIANSRPHGDYTKSLIELKDLPKTMPKCNKNPLYHDSISKGENILEKLWRGDRRLPLFGYTIETIEMLMVPMFKTKKEALGSMGNDAPLACLSGTQPLIYDYFKQLFAQVTNPPIDPFREKVVMSLECPVGPEGNILCPSVIQRLWLSTPILSPSELGSLSNISNWTTSKIDITYPSSQNDLKAVLDTICSQVRDSNSEILVLSDRNCGPNRIPVSSALAAGAVHHTLISSRKRSKCALVLETGEAREVHHLCVLLGFGVDAICPYMVYETAALLFEEGIVAINEEEAFKSYVAAVDRGISKVMAKMGISTLQSYKGAQIFEAIGIGTEVMEVCFKGTASRVSGATFDSLSKEAAERHALAFHSNTDSGILRNPGYLHWRSGGENHINDPSSISNLQEATKHGNSGAYDKFVSSTMDSVRKCTLRGQLEIYNADMSPIDISEVEPASEIVKRFATGAMSFGSISYEAHSALAVAMNSFGGKSNTGEGGESESRYLQPKTRSAIKQIASGRFGVTASYLAHADELQIKMAQGAKPGEGGELPGYKVTPDIAATRHSVPGVGLISPPPHHDIYSIEDLAQLIYDLKASNPQARVSVKLVSEVGVGIVASGVAKGKAEHILISGHDGGTGASSWTGIKGAGLPWELGLAETHQTLVLNNLRSRVVVQADGQLRTGFDVVVGGLLGADEFGFSTAPLIVMGCTMMRKCHLNTCPVGIATQDPILRKKFEGKPEHVVNYFFMVAEEVRKIMSSIGVKKFQDLIGQTKFLKQCDSVRGKSALLNLSSILISAQSMRQGIAIKGGSQDFNLESRLDNAIIKDCEKVLENGSGSVELSYSINNSQRSFGSTLSYKIASIYNEKGLSPDTIKINLNGSAGQSFCAFLVSGVNVKLEGDANDYVGKGLSGGTITIFPPKNSLFNSEDNVIVGNVCLYGATSGKAFFRGLAAERFCVRNSGATAVVEGIGDHGCEYMTGGRVVVLGDTGRNFGAGMSGGIAYIYCKDKLQFKEKCNLGSIELETLDAEDEVWMKNILSEFVDETGSYIASNILSQAKIIKSFVKVFPIEYKNVLNSNKNKTATNIDIKQKENKFVETEDKIADIEDLYTKQLDKVKGFTKYERETDFYRDVNERSKDWNEITNYPKIRKGLRKQAARCMDCGVPFCHSNSHGCPLGNIIPSFNDLVFKNQWEEALKQLLQTNNFPEFTGRVCPAPCEGSCVLGINAPPVTIKNIECSIIDNAFEKGWIQPRKPLKRTSKRVAIIGSGPAGLAAADQLNKAGHLVTVYERNNRIGGLLQYGIPTMKLSKDVVQRRVDIMEQEGVKFLVNHNVNSTNIKNIKNEFDALLFCTGATVPRDLPIPGRNSNGIYFAMEFLQKNQQSLKGDKVEAIDAKGLDVIVIGGGDTGNDCIGTSVRMGAKSVVTFEILPQSPDFRSKDNPWPQYPRVFKVDYGHEEVQHKWGGDPRRYNTMSKEFIVSDSGCVTGVKTVLVEWTKDHSGKWVMATVPDSEKVYSCQLVLLAMGFLGPEKGVLESVGVILNSRGNISDTNYSTSVKGIFGAGDCRRGQSLVVWAISEGRQAARKVDEYLVGSSELPVVGGIVLPAT